MQVGDLVRVKEFLTIAFKDWFGKLGVVVNVNPYHTHMYTVKRLDNGALLALTPDYIEPAPTEEQDDDY